LRGKDDGLTALAPIRDRFPYFADLLPASQRLICSPESIGRPLGDDRFLAGIERRNGRSLKPGKCGPKPSTPESRS
jgi:putative transposase